MKLSKPEIRMRIDRQKTLLKERRNEYTIFGATSEDLERDQEIIAEIKELESELDRAEE